jgi:glycosyltransferase involved in cell wall biosynthesis
MPITDIAIIANSQTPYRLHLHQRIARELAGIRLWSIFTHETSNAPWSFNAPAEINSVLLGAGESADQQSNVRNSGKEWRRGAGVIRLLMEKNVRAVVMMGYNDLGRLRVMRWCYRNGIPCFMFGDSNVHGDHVTGARALVKRALIQRVSKWCRGFLACGSLGRAYFKRYGVSDDRIFYFPYEPDYELIRTITPQQIEAVRQRFGLDPARRRLVYSGRLVDVKRVDLLIDAFAQIADQRPEWDLLIIGDGPLRQALEQRVATGLTSRINWTGFLDNQEVVSSLYRSCDVLVLPSDFEPWALVINEAAAAGLAIVCSNVVGAAAELVRPGINGQLFSPGSVEQAAVAILEVTESDQIDRMKAQSPKILRDWQKQADPVEGLRAALASVGICLPPNARLP